MEHDDDEVLARVLRGWDDLPPQQREATRREIAEGVEALLALARLAAINLGTAGPCLLLLRAALAEAAAHAMPSRWVAALFGVLAGEAPARRGMRDVSN